MNTAKKQYWFVSHQYRRNFGQWSFGNAVIDEPPASWLVKGLELASQQGIEMEQILLYAHPLSVVEFRKLKELV